MTGSRGAGPPSVLRRRVLISGRVQGVFFRQETADRARSHGVAGWVRNLADGRVEAVFEGPRESVARLIDWSRRGPRLAEVDDVEVVEEPPAGDSGFSIR